MLGRLDRVPFSDSGIFIVYRLITVHTNATRPRDTHYTATVWREKWNDTSDPVSKGPRSKECGDGHSSAKLDVRRDGRLDFYLVYRSNLLNRWSRLSKLAEVTIGASFRLKLTVAALPIRRFSMCPVTRCWLRLLFFKYRQSSVARSFQA